MPLLEWSQALDVGVEEMNREHREILNAMNAVYDAAHRGVQGPEMMALIGRLATVTQRHFEDEERFMERTGFPGLVGHKAMHTKLLTDFGKHVQDAEATGGRPTKDFFDFLRLWLNAHIKHIDRKYGDHAAVTGSRAA